MLFRLAQIGSKLTEKWHYFMSLQKKPQKRVLKLDKHKIFKMCVKVDFDIRQTSKLLIYAKIQRTTWSSLHVPSRHDVEAQGLATEFTNDIMLSPMNFGLSIHSVQERHMRACVHM